MSCEGHALSEGNEIVSEPARRTGRGRRRLAPDQDSSALTSATKADIIETATREFVKNGFAGASINVIAAATHTSKRMLYYHFRSKVGLYRAVLEAAYERMASAEPGGSLDGMPPMEALRRYAEEAFDMHLNNEDFVSLVMAENLNEAAVIRDSAPIRSRITGNLSRLESIWKLGCEEGVMRADIRLIDLYLAITAISFSTISNRATLRVSLGIDLGDPTELKFRRKLVADVACAYAAKPLAAPL